MPGRHHAPELHRSNRAGWLRAAVLGAQDGIVSTAALLIGIAAASASRDQVWVAGVAALVAGAMSMAAGEYSSVSSQRDAEEADIARERRELRRYPEHELDELTGIYVERGLTRPLAREVATQLMEADPLGSHVRDELGLTPATRARPVQAALVSAASFALGAALALIPAVTAPSGTRVAAIAAVTVVLLAALGVTGARLGGAAPVRAAARIVLGGGAAMAVTWAVGQLVGAAV